MIIARWVQGLGLACSVLMAVPATADAAAKAVAILRKLGVL